MPSIAVWNPDAVLESPRNRGISPSFSTKELSIQITDSIPDSPPGSSISPSKSTKGQKTTTKSTKLARKSPKRKAKTPKASTMPEMFRKESVSTPKARGPSSPRAKKAFRKKSWSGSASKIEIKPMPEETENPNIPNKALDEL